MTETGPCPCGCGVQTKIATRNSANGIKGQPRMHNRRRRNPAAYFVEEDRGYDTPCWIWQGARDGQGYGHVGRGGRWVRAHRRWYEDHVGPIPEGHDLDHLCRVKLCVRPDHMEPVTHAENVRRGRGSKLTVEQVREIRAAEGTRVEIGRRYGVSHVCVTNIKNRKRWADVD